MKGMIEVVEVVLGMLLTISIFLIIYRNIEEPKLTPLDAKFKILALIKTLDEQGILANLVLKNDTETLEGLLKSSLPLLNVSVSVDESKADIPARDVYSIVYFVAGNYTYFKPSKLTVYMWFS